MNCPMSWLRCLRYPCFLCLMMGLPLPPAAAQDEAPAETVTGEMGSGRRHRSVLVTSAEPIVSARAIVVFEPEVRSAPVVEAPEAFPAIIPHAAARPAEVAKLPGELWKITVILEPGDLKPKAKLTVVSTTESGRSVVSPVQWLMPDEAAQNYGQLAEVRCDQQRASGPLKRLMTRSAEDLRKLAGVRKQRRRLLEELVRERLTSTAIERLTAMERQMSKQTNSAEPQAALSRTMPLEELVDRLIALQAFRDGAASGGA